MLHCIWIVQPVVSAPISVHRTTNSRQGDSWPGLCWREYSWTYFGIRPLHCTGLPMDVILVLWFLCDVVQALILDSLFLDFNVGVYGSRGPEMKPLLAWPHPHHLSCFRQFIHRPDDDKGKVEQSWRGRGGRIIPCRGRQFSIFILSVSC